MSDPATRLLKARALELGFSRVGVARAERLEEEGARLLEWLRRGYDGTMRWMGSRAGERIDPSTLLPGAASVVSVAMNYYTPERHSAAPGTGKISRYAWGDDYHDVLGEKMAALWSWMQDEFPGVRGRWYVDTGPVMDKAWAQRAGIGWVGKHANVITKDFGSWVFLGTLVTSLELEADPPAADHCGTCALCIEACPTGAITEPYVVDSRACLSYLTIEHRGEVSGEIARHYEGWIFGCDTCQDVCPWNDRFARETAEPRFAPRPNAVDPDLAELASLTPAGFEERFRGSPVRRARHDGFLRNVRIARSGGAT